MMLTETKSIYAYLSKSILSLCDYEADAEMLFTLSIYLKMLVIKFACPIDELKYFTDQLLKHLKTRVSPDFNIDEDDLSNLFIENMELLSEIKSEVWRSIYPESLLWLRGWEDICKNTFQSSDQAKEDSVILLRIVDDHLEILPQHALIVLNLIHKSF
jgi:hypothetical protein